MSLLLFCHIYYGKKALAKLVGKFRLSDLKLSEVDKNLKN